MNKDNEVLVEATVDENGAAIVLGVRKREVRWLTKRGVLPTVRVADRIMYSRSGLAYFSRLLAEKSLDYGPCD